MLIVWGGGLAQNFLHLELHEWMANENICQFFFFKIADECYA